MVVVIYKQAHIQGGNKISYHQLPTGVAGKSEIVVIPIEVVGYDGIVGVERAGGTAALCDRGTVIDDRFTLIGGTRQDLRIIVDLHCEILHDLGAWQIDKDIAHLARKRKLTQAVFYIIIFRPDQPNLMQIIQRPAEYMRRLAAVDGHCSIHTQCFQ